MILISISDTGHIGFGHTAIQFFDFHSFLDQIRVFSLDGELELVLVLNLNIPVYQDSGEEGFRRSKSVIKQN